MSKKNTIRKDKTCLNCNYVVENRFCSNCGQENIDTRKSFTHLFVHFFEDLTHYENAFWRTIKNLIFRPASLTKEYLSGKRMSYLAPVRLYIFISFVTFFLISVLPKKEENDEETKTEKKAEDNSTNFYSDESKEDDNTIEFSIDSTKAKTDSIKKDSIPEELKQIINLEKKGLISKKYADSLKKYVKEAKEKNDEDDSGFMNFGKKYKSVAELDSIQKFAKPSEKLNSFEYWLAKKNQTINDKYTGKEIEEKFVESFEHNLPKALFVYMPLFAFVLWLFQNKKRWYYFDHGIFTLHYFSFLLLGILSTTLVNYLFSFFDEYWIIKSTKRLLKIVVIIYMFYYFFPAHHRFYEEKRVTSIIKGIVMFFINFMFMAIILTLFALYSFLSIH